MTNPVVSNGSRPNCRSTKNHQLDDCGNCVRQSGRGTFGSVKCCKSSSNANAGANESRLNSSASSVCSSASRAAWRFIVLNRCRFACIQFGDGQSAAGVEKFLILPAAWSCRQCAEIFCQ